MCFPTSGNEDPDRKGQIMLTPEYLFRVTEGAEKISSDMHRNIMDMIIERMMARLGRGEDYLLTATDRWQIQVLQESGYLLEDIQKEIADKTKKQESELKSVFEEAGIKAIERDDAIYRAVGLSPVPLLQSPALLRILERDYNATLGEWQNLTRTTADEAQKLFINEVDNAYHMVSSGAVSYTKAVRDAVERIAKQGVKISYPSGREVSIESATMTAVRTGVGQCAGAVSMKRMEEMDWDIILVSAHVGARTGDGGMNPTNHFWWQGKFYSRTGRDKRFPDFRTSTGYGTVTGLCGVNCRHSFGSGDGENNPYHDLDLSSEDNIKAEERAKKQRLLERRIRNSKRELQNLQTAIDGCGDDKFKFEVQQEYDRKSAVLRRQNKQYQQFCKDNGLKEYSERLKVAQWNRSQAVKSAKAAQRYIDGKGDAK